MIELIGRQLAWMRGDGPESDVVLTSRVRLARNILEFPFPSHAESSELKQVMEKITRAVSRVDREKSLIFYPLDETSRFERQVLAERYLASGDHLADIKNRALFLSHKGAISLMINEEDHLRMQCILSGLSPMTAWQILDRLETLLAEKLHVAYAEPFGYLTSYLSNTGTGLRVSVMIHLPGLALQGRLIEVLTAAATLGTTVRGLYGEGSVSAGNLYQISNSMTVGLNEVEIIHRVLATANHLIHEEREARQQLYHNRRIEVEDRVFRALGILTHCRKISTAEATQLLSDLRLGVDLELISNIDVPTINELLLSIRPGWIQLETGYSLDPEMRDIKRATMLAEQLISNPL